MVYFARVLISGRQKIALALLLAAVIGFFSFYPRIMEVLLAFLLGGEVPGTHIILSPDVVMAIVAGVLGVGFITLCLRLYFRAGHNSRNFIQVPIQSVTETIKVDVTAAAKAEKQIEVRIHSDKVLSKRKRLTKSSEIVFGRIAEAAYRSWLIIQKVSLAIYAGVSSFVHATGNVLVTLLGLVWLASWAIVKAIWQGVHWSARTLRWGTTAVWRWAQPYLRRFDAWLEVQVRKLETYTKKRLNSRDSVRTLSAMGSEYRKSMHDLHPKSVVRAARQRIRQAKTVVTTPEQR